MSGHSTSEVALINCFAPCRNNRITHSCVVELNELVSVAAFVDWVECTIGEIVLRGAVEVSNILVGWNDAVAAIVDERYPP